MTEGLDIYSLAVMGVTMSKTQREIKAKLGRTTGPTNQDVERWRKDAESIVRALDAWYSHYSTDPQGHTREGKASLVTKIFGLTPAGDATEIFGLFTSGKAPLGHGGTHAREPEPDKQSVALRAWEKAVLAQIGKWNKRYEQCLGRFATGAARSTPADDLEYLASAVYDANTLSDQLEIKRPVTDEVGSSRYAMFVRG